MTKEYIEEQKVAYKLLMNSIKKNRSSHAYFFETNGYSKSFDFILSFVKELFNENDIINENIDKNIFSELEIINPDGLWIKKEQVDVLQKKLKSKAIEAKKRIYIINQAEKLNASAANSILKFLEEPEPNIIAILISNNSYHVLDTIVSRCQVISLKKDIDSNNISINQEMMEKIFYFVTFYEQNRINTILYLEKIWHNHIKSKEDFIRAFDFIILFYKDIFNYQNNLQLKFFKEKEETIKKISLKNSKQRIMKKIQKFIEFKNYTKNNVNSSLLIDKLIIELEENND